MRLAVFALVLVIFSCWDKTLSASASRSSSSPPELDPWAGRALIMGLDKLEAELNLYLQEKLRGQKCPPARETLIIPSSPLHQIEQCSNFPRIIVDGQEMEKQLDEDYFHFLSSAYHKIVRCQRDQLRCLDPQRGSAPWLKMIREATIKKAQALLMMTKLIHAKPFSEREEKDLAPILEKLRTTGKFRELLPALEDSCNVFFKEFGSKRSPLNGLGCQEFWLQFAAVSSLERTSSYFLENTFGEVGLKKKTLMMLLEDNPPQRCEDFQVNDLKVLVDQRSRLLAQEDLRLSDSCVPLKKGSDPMAVLSNGTTANRTPQEGRDATTSSSSCRYQPSYAMKRALWNWIKPSAILAQSLETKGWYCRSDLLYGKHYDDLQKEISTDLTLASLPFLLIPFIGRALWPLAEAEFAALGKAQLVGAAAVKSHPLAASRIALLGSTLGQVPSATGGVLVTQGLIESCFPDSAPRAPNKEIDIKTRTLDFTEEGRVSIPCNCDNELPSLWMGINSPSCQVKLAEMGLDKALEKISSIANTLKGSANKLSKGLGGEVDLDKELEGKLERTIGPFAKIKSLLNEDKNLQRLERWAQLCAGGNR
jgi:hypothetical protein